jgi:hypothetical protein
VLAVACASVVAWNQLGTGADAGRPSRRDSAQPLAGDFGNLGDRLRATDGGLAIAPDPTTAPPEGDAAIAPPPAEFTEPAAPAPPPPAELRHSRFDGVVPSGGVWAVMIGINDYPGSRHDLRSAVNDASDVNEALARFGVPGDHRLLIRDGQATAGTVRTAAEWLTAHAGPDATAVFFYAGHVRKLDQNTEAIIGADGGTVTDADLAGLLDGLRATKAWIGIAACYGGGFTELLKPGRVLSAAASANSLAYENEGFGRSYFVEYMVRRGMIANAMSTVEGAFAYAQTELRRDYPDRVPVQFDSLAGDLDLKAPRPGAAASKPTPGSGSAPAGSSSPTTTAPPKANGEPPPPEPGDGCANLTGGLVRCQGT